MVLDMIDIICRISIGKTQTTLNGSSHARRPLLPSWLAGTALVQAHAWTPAAPACTVHAMPCGAAVRRGGGAACACCSAGATATRFWPCMHVRVVLNFLRRVRGYSPGTCHGMAIWHGTAVRRSSASLPCSRSSAASFISIACIELNR